MRMIPVIAIVPTLMPIMIMAVSGDIDNNTITEENN